MKYETFRKKVYAHLGRYKKDVLRVAENVKIGDHIYRHILPDDKKNLNLILIGDGVGQTENKLILPNYNETIKLHTHWHHLNSSQILCISYFYKFINDKVRLNSLLEYLGINEKAEKGMFEVIAGEEKTNVDFAIKLTSGKFVYFEIKYTESNFGKTSTNVDVSVYDHYFENHSKTVEIDRKAYDEYYQLVRNVCLSADGNYTVFLLPRVNESININYEKGMRKIQNFSEHKNSVKRVMWEDLLLAFPDKEVFEKYFNFMR